MTSVNTNDIAKIPISTTKKNYNGIDLVKFICAILVVIIHIPPFPTGLPKIFDYISFGLQQYVCRLAVPFFFMASGFFLFQKMDFCNIKKDIIQKYCFNLLRLLGIWSVLLFVGETYHLWYIGATVVAIVLLSVLLQKGIKYQYILIIAGTLYIFGLLGNSYYNVTESIRQVQLFDYVISTYEFFFETTRNGVFMGLLFVLIGAIFAQHKNRMHISVAVVGFFISMLLLLCEVAALKIKDFPKDYNMYIFLVPATVFLFLIAIKLNLKDRPIYKKLRSAGVLIYFLHYLVKKCIEFGFEIINNFLGINCFQYLFFSTIVLTIALAFLIEYLSNKEKFKWLKWLYT